MGLAWYLVCSHGNQPPLSRVPLSAVFYGAARFLPQTFRRTVVVERAGVASILHSMSLFDSQPQSSFVSHLNNDHLSIMAFSFKGLNSLRLQSCCLVIGEGR
ncbi:hypothetical protein Fmac_005719 [Flemingia macrophylla]|uniref:Uncharacterized protein n=1 Tax=Flemingia macrophylla TaxID=520843 RepID=A0ABD1N8M1_9FABA